jgi:1,4-alpha-glucan branching enzyme
MALVICNFTPVPRQGYRLGVPEGVAQWREVLNTDAPCYGGSGMGNASRALRRIARWQPRAAQVHRAGPAAAGVPDPVARMSVRLPETLRPPGRPGAGRTLVLAAA